MVDGVYGLKGHVVRHVAVELESTLDHVTILYPHVEAYPAMGVVPLKKLAIKIVVVVSYVRMYLCMHASLCILFKFQTTFLSKSNLKC